MLDGKPRYTQYQMREIEVVDTLVDRWFAGCQFDFLRMTTKSGHVLSTKYYKPEHVQMRGKQMLKICYDRLQECWLVNFEEEKV